MNMLYRLFFKKIIYLSIFLQVIFCVSFAMMQTPDFLNIVRGIKFSFVNFIIILSLRVLEWLNFITIVAFIIAIFFVFSQAKEQNILIFFLQLARPVNDIIRPIFILSFFYGVLFIFIDGFFVPYGKFYLKEKMFELSKEHFISSIQPMHIVNYASWNFAVSARPSEEKLEGVVLNKESNPELTLLVSEVIFKNEDRMSLSLNKGCGKIKLQEEEFFLFFDSGTIIAAPDFLSLKRNSQYLSLFDMNLSSVEDLYEIFKRTWLFFVSLLLSFWIFILFFNEILYIKYFSSFCLLTMLFTAIEVIPFNVFIFFGSALIIYIFYRKTVTSC